MKPLAVPQLPECWSLPVPAAPLPVTEAERLSALRSYDILDTACENTFDNIAELAAQLTESPISFVSLTDAERQWFKARKGLPVVEVPREQSFCAWAILKPGEVTVVPDARVDPRFADNPLVLGEPDIRFYAGAPLVNRDGAALGTLCVLDRQPRQFTETQRQILARLADTVITTLELRRVMAQVRRLALVDSLTGLANRSVLFDAIDASIRRQQQGGTGFTLLYLDLDGFKAVNDREGHAAGDAVLREVAAILTGVASDQDVVARLGGDEFGVVLNSDPAEAPALAERIRDALAAGMAARNWAVTASVGAASFHAAPPSVDQAVGAADALMYGAKVSGKNQVLHRAYQSA
jgi:diguanylate cyclase (GGDEF)-like protein